MKKTITREEWQELRTLLSEARRYYALAEDRLDEMTELFKVEDFSEIDWLMDAANGKEDVSRALDWALEMMKVTVKP